MKIAYFSPFPPQKSGISDYSVYLVEALSSFAEVDLWVDGFDLSSEHITNKFRIYDYVNNPEHLTLLNNYDEIIYNIGNNPYYHSHIYDVFLKYNGVVILHEYVLYYLITGYYLDLLHDSELYLDELMMNHGDGGYAEGLRILHDSLPPLQYKFPEKLPLNKRLIDHARGIIVHSEYARNEVLKINPNANCRVISQIGPNADNINVNADRKRELRQKYNISDDDILIASFGYVSSSKRIHQVVEALSQLPITNYKYLLVGEGDYVKPLLKKHRLQDKVIFTGFTTIEEFDELIAVSDIIVNLRYPYMGETSASLIRALLLGKVALVTDIGWFRELSDKCVIKIPLDENEVANIRHQLERLIGNAELRESYSTAIQAYADSELDPRKIARNIVAYLGELQHRRQKERLFNAICDEAALALNGMGVQEESFYVKDVSELIYSVIKTRGE
ncbi:glycosyltransferase family 4 protein [Paenibacillus xerothermodurans]|uniref:Glycosyltransferase n=1 Tax=Paenibacillus xerothermodurans TaxID=1977292 RepID=A0A2W1NCM9_PAEXE|nr:glycosyltransferase family 4 protein [Paenibacillus xerothermodurans]PZE20811.1 glycosyltransferase [Paenibacillus xerothermodurans]